MKRWISFLLIIAFLIIGALSATAETRTLTARFEGVHNPPTDLQKTVEMDDDWFDASSTQYNHSLARLSLCMAVSAFRKTVNTYLGTDVNIRSFLNEAGFEGYAAYDYERNPSDSTISNAIAYRRLSDDQGGYVLVAVPICGQGYGNEWLSNFSVGSTVGHTGFESSAEKVYDRLMAYIDEHLSGERIKIWVSGFSRAAAVSNALGNLLLNDNRFGYENVFVYTFGTPNTSKASAVWPQIFNICNGFDPVSKIPFSEWGYGKHGNTLYLPTRCTNENYDALAEKAKGVYTEITGSEKGFDASNERNWLLERVLHLLYKFMPESQIYSSAYQSGLIAAWNCDGSILDRMNIFMQTASDLNCDTSGIERVRDELLVMLKDTLDYTAGLVTHEEVNTNWLNAVTSGADLMHEHFPVMYLSWMFSIDDPEALLSANPSFRRVEIEGLVNTTIYEIDPATGAEHVVYDAAKKIAEVPSLKLGNVTGVDLFTTKNYRVQVTTPDQTDVQLSFGTYYLRDVYRPLLQTNAITMYPKEFISADIAANVDTEYAVTVSLDNQVLLGLYPEGESYDMRSNDGTSVEYEGNFDKLMSNLIIMIPYVGSCIALLIYMLVVLIKRLIRGRVDDRVPCNKTGRVLLIIVSMLSLFAFMYNGFLLYRYLFAKDVVLQNHTLQRISEFLGYGKLYYITYNLFVNGLIALLACRSISHSLSRKRLFRLSMLVLMYNILSTYLALDLNTFTSTFVIYQLLPVVSLIAVIVANEYAIARGSIIRQNKPMVVCIIWTMLLFLLYQVLLILSGQNFGISVTKIMTGLPVVLLCFRLWIRRMNVSRLYILLAMICYMTANVLINRSLQIGMLIYIIGHVLMIMGLLRAAGMVKWWQVLVWIGLTLVFSAEIALLESRLPSTVVQYGMLYTAFVCATVTASLRVSHTARIGALFFLLSNQLLVFTFIYPDSTALHCMELLLFYIAVILLAADHEKPQKIDG